MSPSLSVRIRHILRVLPDDNSRCNFVVGRGGVRGSGVQSALLRFPNSPGYLQSRSYWDIYFSEGRAEEQAAARGLRSLRVDKEGGGGREVVDHTRWGVA